MAAEDSEEGQTSNERIRRGVGRTLANGTLLFVALGVLAAWGYLGLYELKPGESAVILTLGSYDRTEENPGLHWHLPPPISTHDVVDVSRVQRAEFGLPSEGTPTEKQRLEGTVQTRDNNIVEIHFVVQYRIKNAFYDRYRIAAPGKTLRDAAQAAIREVIGRTSIDAVLTDQRGAVQSDTREQLQQLLDEYDSGLRVDSVELKEVEAPEAVRRAFDDVISASQDRTRSINEAEGYANEVVPQARAVAVELKASSEAYRDSVVAIAIGQTGLFNAILKEYLLAPEVTSRRLYLETMEEILPKAEKVVLEPGMTDIVPYLPVGPAGRSVGSLVRPGSGTKPEKGAAE